MNKGTVTKPIFIIGCGRSGTTLLFNMFKKHPHLMPTTGYPDGEDHIGWIKHGKCVISGLGYPKKTYGHVGYHHCLYMNEFDVSKKIVESMTNYYYKKVLKRKDSKRIINKNPHLSNKLRYVKAIFPDAKFIHIIRDCLPVVSSWIRIMEDQPKLVLYWPDTDFPCLWVSPVPIHSSERKKIFGKEERIYPGKGVKLFAEYWSVVNMNIPMQLSDAPGQLFTVKYEDICNDPLMTLRSICEFCEIEPFSEIPVDVYPHNNEKYKEVLNDEQVQLFLEISQKGRRYFGYV